MDNTIYNLQTKRNISLSKAVKSYGVKSIKDNTKFRIPEDKIAVFDNGRYKLLSRTKVSNIINSKEFNPVNILSSNFIINEKNKLEKPTIKPIESLNILRQSKSKVLNSNDKQNPYLLLDFLRANNISGSGKFVVTQNGKVIYENDLTIGNNLTKWWKDGGYLTGIVDSDKFAWFSTNNETQYYGNITFRDKDGKNTGTPKIIPRTGKDADKIINQVFDERTTIIFTPNVNVDLKKIQQVFRDNITSTCFFDNAIDILSKKKETKTQKDLIKKLTKLKNIYPNGVTEEDLQNICNTSQLNVYITDALNNDFRKFKCNKKDYISINLINDKFNHLSKNEFIDFNSNIIEVKEQEDMQKIFLNNIGQKHFYYIGSLNNLLNIYTSEGTYKYINPENELINEFNKEIKIFNYSLDLCNSSDKQKYNFISKGVNYFSHCLINEDNECNDNINYKEYDMRNAYIQYKKNKHYLGFCNIMNHIVNVDNEWDIKKYVGYYNVQILDFENNNTEKIFNGLGIKKNQYYVLSSIMLLHFRDWKINFNLISGCYSFDSIDIDLTNEIIQNKLYCKWTGKLNSVNYSNNINVLGSWELAETLRNNYENVSCNKYFNSIYESSEKKMDLDDELQEIRITFDKKKVNYLGHIGGFITDYTRTTVIDKLLNYNFEDIIGFKLDGFVIKSRGHSPPTFQDEIFINDKTPLHHIKNCIHNNKSLWTLKHVKYTFDWGYTIFQDSDLINGIDKFKNKYELLTGVGGAGKTTSIFCKDYGYGWEDTLFIAGNWKLITEKINEYNIKGITIHQLIGECCQSYGLSNKHPSKIIYDECNTYSKEWIEQAFELYPNSQHILLGDMEIKNNNLNYFQCSGKDVNVIDLDFFKKYNLHIEHNPNNYRCKDKKLLEILNKVRELQLKGLYKTKEYIKQEFEIITIDKLKENYDYKNDWVLCSTTNDTCKEKPQTKFYSELLQGKKYLVTRHNAMDIKKRLDGLDSKLKGEIVIDPVKLLEKYEQRDAFTIHSFQGLTVKQGQTLYFDINRLFDVRQIYTSLSRVEYFEQIKLIC